MSYSMPDPRLLSVPSDILHGRDDPSLLREEILADLLEHSARTPDKVALMFGARELTYAQLDSLA
ncbi:hypothetical protein LP420_41565 [Massilia sp. B-10]|nr:hypothetical protein LP420_41565 [Massilia sp. B-10]